MCGRYSTRLGDSPEKALNIFIYYYSRIVTMMSGLSNDRQARHAVDGNFN